MLDDVNNWNAQSDGLVHTLHRSSLGPALFAADLNPGETVCRACNMVEPYAGPCC